MACPDTRDFAAWIDLMPGDESRLIVAGEVKTTSGNLLPRLAEAEPQGINPRDLLLVLSLEQCGEVGTDDVAYRPVRFEKPAVRDQYATVTVLSDGEICFTLEVTEAS
ncbi:hypothetical protein [Amaricoccus solimangrovi]|uniref:Uncharacterized protein n=1 Tax=Amaricoccus solimangrovi TaxID=2589815 RepID=A0A501WT52_9RHOB|nr:hypothetical protein [Amaricoccus solimangrovi]TPE50191.1 hypothetical protein FJM51_12460 [Amaricoccus solimangrovi]